MDLPETKGQCHYTQKINNYLLANRTPTGTCVVPE